MDAALPSQFTRNTQHHRVTDEDCFHLSWYVNSQNSSTWAAKNPFLIHKELLNPRKWEFSATYLVKRPSTPFLLHCGQCGIPLCHISRESIAMILSLLEGCVISTAIA
jgi:hypothetical protein